MIIEAGGHSDKGKTRETNQDALFVGSNSGVFAVADGVGGAVHGEVASKIFVETVKEWSHEYRYQTASRRDFSSITRPGVMHMVTDVFNRASARIFEYTTQHPDHVGMCTTGAIMATVLEDTQGWAIIGHVGDTRVYMIRDGKPHRLTRDHTFAYELFNAGLIAEKDLKRSIHRHVLSKAVGKYPTVKPDLLWVDLLPEDIFLLCTDGLTDLIEDHELPDLTKNLSAGEIATRLVNLANERGGHDNITLISLRIIGELFDETTIEATQRINFLRDLGLFEGMTEQEILWFLKVVYVEWKRPGDIIFQEGDKGRDMYIVEDGEVVITKSDKVLNILKKGDHFGELAIFDNKPRSATAKAKNRCTLFKIPGDELLKLTENEPAIAARILWRLMQNAANRIRELSEKLV